MSKTRYPVNVVPEIIDPVSLTLSTVLFPLTNLVIKARKTRSPTKEKMCSVKRMTPCDQGCRPGLGQLAFLCIRG